MHDEVKKCVESKDIKGLRYIFVDCLDVDPTFEKYSEDYEYSKKVVGLFEEYKELTPLTDNRSCWDNQYWQKIKADLMKNFSVKRFQHMIQVAKVVYADKIERIKKERAQYAEAKQNVSEMSKTAKSTIATSQPQIQSQITVSQENVASQIKKSPTIQEKEQTLAEESRQLAREYEESLRREREQKKRLEQKRQELQAANVRNNETHRENDLSKKAVGIVLVIVLLLIILLIVKNV